MRILVTDYKTLILAKIHDSVKVIDEPANAGETPNRIRSCDPGMLGNAKLSAIWCKPEVRKVLERGSAQRPTIDRRCV